MSGWRWWTLIVGTAVTLSMLGTAYFVVHTGGTVRGRGGWEKAGPVSPSAKPSPSQRVSKSPKGRGR